MICGIQEAYLPPMIRVYGAPGTGKTLVVRKALTEVQSTVGDEVFNHIYVNLKRCRTVTTAVNTILETLCGHRVSKNLGTDRIFQELWKVIEQQY
jgi:Cdc6-like AAA superfamily ATPase